MPQVCLEAVVVLEKKQELPSLAISFENRSVEMKSLRSINSVMPNWG